MATLTGAQGLATGQCHAWHPLHHLVLLIHMSFTHCNQSLFIAVLVCPKKAVRSRFPIWVCGVRKWWCVFAGRYHGALLTNQEEWEWHCVRAGRQCGDLVHPLIYCPELHYAEFSSSVADMKNSSAVSGRHIPSVSADSWHYNSPTILKVTAVWDGDFVAKLVILLKYGSLKSQGFIASKLYTVVKQKLLRNFQHILYWWPKRLCQCFQDRSNAEVSCAGLFIGSHIGFDFAGTWIHIDMAYPVYSVSTSSPLTALKSVFSVWKIVVQRSRSQIKVSPVPQACSIAQNCLLALGWSIDTNVLQTKGYSHYMQYIWQMALILLVLIWCVMWPLQGERATGYGVALLTAIFGEHSCAGLLQDLAPPTNMLDGILTNHEESASKKIRLA